MSDTRDRMLEATASLIRRRGHEASSLSQILEAADAPRGSLYHHFPGGKDQLVLEATRASVDWLTDLLAQALAASADTTVGFRAYVDGAVEELRRSDYGLGCPVASVVLDNPATGSPLAELCREAVETWERMYADHLEAAGLDRERAGALASLMISAVEGAILVARARRTTEPLIVARDELSRLIESALAGLRP